MPIYRYRAQKKGCGTCEQGFEVLQNIKEDRLKKCPHCGAKVKRIISSFSIKDKKPSLDQRAKNKGFHKLKKVDKGKYEKLY